MLRILFAIFLLLVPAYSDAFQLIKPSVVAASASWYGFPTAQSSNLGNNNNQQYFFKIPSVLSSGGTLTKYKAKINDGGSNAQLTLCLYTHNSGTDRPNTLVTNSCASTPAVSSFPQTYEVSVASPPSVSAAQYWIAVQPVNLGTVAGTTTSGTYYQAYSGGTPVATFIDDGSFTGTPGVLEIEVTP